MRERIWYLNLTRAALTVFFLRWSERFQPRFSWTHIDRIIVVFFSSQYALLCSFSSKRINCCLPAQKSESKLSASWSWFYYLNCRMKRRKWIGQYCFFRSNKQKISLVKMSFWFWEKNEKELLTQKWVTYGSNRRRQKRSRLICVFLSLSLMPHLK